MHSTQKKIFIIYIIGITIILSLLLIGLTIVKQNSIENLIVEQSEKKIEQKLEFFDHFKKHETIILNSLVHNPYVQDFILSKNDTQELKNLLNTILQMHHDIVQIRYIDEQGYERLRVNNSDTIEAVTKENLQNKHNRYYFQDAMKKKSSEVYYSNIDLNIEYGKIQSENIATLRVAKHIILNSTSMGIFILNIDVSEYINTLQKDPLYHISLIYDDGHVIVTNDKKYNWSRDWEKDVNIFNIVPSLPRNYATLGKAKIGNLFLHKIDFASPNKIYILVSPKKQLKYSSLNYTMQKVAILLIILTIVSIPIGYFLIKYIDKMYTDKLQITQLSYVDELTQIFNRRAYNEKINESINQYQRYSTKFSLIMYDIDDFKKINDQYGHKIGDKFLVATSKQVESAIRITDMFFRVGGEEFILILPNTDTSKALILAEKIRKTIEGMRVIEDKKVTISLGLTEFKEDDNIDTIYKRVDSLMYKSKVGGKNQINVG